MTQSLAGYNRPSLDPSGSDFPFLQFPPFLSFSRRWSNLESKRLGCPCKEDLFCQANQVFSSWLLYSALWHRPAWNPGGFKEIYKAFSIIRLPLKLFTQELWNPCGQKGWQVLVLLLLWLAHKAEMFESRQKNNNTTFLTKDPLWPCEEWRSLTLLWKSKMFLFIALALNAGLAYHIHTLTAIHPQMFFSHLIHHSAGRGRYKGMMWQVKIQGLGVECQAEIF